MVDPLPDTLIVVDSVVFCVVSGADDEVGGIVSDEFSSVFVVDFSVLDFVVFCVVSGATDEVGGIVSEELSSVSAVDSSQASKKTRRLPITSIWVGGGGGTRSLLLRMCLFCAS